MNKSVVQLVEEWYGQHSATLSRVSTQLSIRSIDAADVATRVVEIRMETPLLLLSASFWNHGSVSVLVINKESKAEMVIDDRKLEPVDDIPLLLDGYFRRIADLGGSRG
jgi:hypothetical protein